MADEFDQYKVEPTDEFEQYKAAPTGDTTPTGYVSPERNNAIMSSRSPTGYGPDGMPSKPEPYVSTDEVRKEQASKQGVNVTTQLPVKTSILQALAANPTERNSFLASYVKSTYGDVPVRMGDASGQLEYLDPKSNKWTAAYPGAAEHIGELPESILATTMGTLGMAGGGIVGGPGGAAAGGSIGAGLGQAIGNYAKNKIGQQFGLNNSIPNEVLINKAENTGLKTGLTDLGLQAIYGVGRGAKTWLFGRQVLKPAEAQELLYAQKRQDQLINEINSQSGGVTFKPWTGQVGEHTEPGARLLAAGKQAINDPRQGHRLHQQLETNEDSLVNYFDNTTLPFRMDGVSSASEGGAPLANAIDQQKFNATQGASAGLANAKDAAASGLVSLPQGNPAQAGRSIRDSLAAKYMQAKQAKQQAYADYQTAAQYDPQTGLSSINIPVSDAVKQQQRKLQIAVSNSVLTSQRNTKSAAVLDNLGDDMNLATVDDTLRYVRKMIRTKDNNKVAGDLTSIDAKQLEAPLAKMRDDYLATNNPEAYDALTKAEQSAKDEANTFKYGLTKNLLTKTGPGQYKLNDAKVVTTILRNQDAGAAAEIASALKSDPTALNEAQNYLFALYRKSVAKDADGVIPDYAKHKKFMDKYGDVIKQFFTDDQQEQLKTLGGFAEAIKTNKDKLKAVNSIWQKDFQGKLDRMSAEQLVNKTIGPSGLSVDETRKMVRVANMYGEDVAGPWKAGIAEKLRERIIYKDGDASRIDADELGKLLADKDAVLKLQAIFGPSYIRNLEMVQKGTALARTTPRDIKAPTKSNWWTDTVRTTVAPPLSSEGRLVTLGQNSRARAYVSKVADALADPAELDRLANTTRRTLLKQQLINSAGTLSQTLLGDHEYDDQQ